MFGKKNGNGQTPQVRSYNCEVCGTDCFTQAGLDRHSSWAHRVAETGEKDKGKALAEPQKQK